MSSMVVLAFFLDLNTDGGIFGDGDIPVDDGQVRASLGIGRELSLQNNLLPFHRAIVDVGNAKLLDGIMQR